MTINLGHPHVKRGGFELIGSFPINLHTAGLSDWVRGQRAYCCSGSSESLKQYKSLTPTEKVNNPDYLTEIVW